MKNFYANLLNQDKAAALAQSQRAMLRGDISFNESNQTKHPRYWATFILVGTDR
jgi:CHAT domain-containing protein